MTLSVAYQNGVYTLDGTDDKCGAAQAASAAGLAFLNADGAVGFGVTTVLPGGTPIHVEAAITIGTWAARGAIAPATTARSYSRPARASVAHRARLRPEECLPVPSPLFTSPPTR